MAGRVLSRCIQLGRVTWINSSVKKCSTLTPSSKEILKELPEHIVFCQVKKKLGFCQVYLVGTIHNTQESVADVQRLVSVVKPDLVYLELCEERQGVLWSEKIPTTKEMVATIMKEDKGYNIFQLLMGWMQQLIARKNKIVHGSEFRIAYKELSKYGGKLVFGDRPVEVTLKRAWRNMTLSEIIKGLLFSPFGLVKLAIQARKMDMDVINRISQDFSKRFPTWAEAFIHERDIYMAKGILIVAKESSRVVAVVGRGHLEGIKKHLQHQQQPDDLSVDDLLTIPPPKHPAKTITSIGVFVAGVAGVAVIWKCI